MKIKSFFAFCCTAAILCAGCSIVSEAAASTEMETEIEAILTAMTLEDKVAQMFVITPEALTGIDGVIAAGESTQACINSIPVGGIVYMEQNLINTEQVKEMLANTQKFSKERINLPMFTCIDEEGGTVARIGEQATNFGVPYVGNMCDIGATGDVNQAYEAGSTIGAYLADLGFNVDFAPDADVLSNPNNQVVRYRSFGSDPELVADMSIAAAKGLKEHGVCAALKHFPGHGATEGDTHAGYAYTSKSLEELESCELVPFQRGVEEKVPFIMAGHISAANVVGDDTPASLSYTMMTEILRNQMGYEGIVITDALNMGAIVNTYSSAGAAVQAIQSGADMLLMPADFQSAYYGVLDAVNNGSVTEERIDESVRRILNVKLNL